MLINCGGSPISDKHGYTEENMAEFVIPVLAPKMPKPEQDNMELQQLPLLLFWIWNVKCSWVKLIQKDRL